MHFVVTACYCCIYTLELQTFKRRLRQESTTFGAMLSSRQSCWQFTKAEKCKAISLLLLIVVSGATCFQIQQQEQPHLPYLQGTVTPPSKLALFNSIDNGDEEPEFEPLDVMLQKARKRGVNPILKVQAFFDAPTLMVAPLYWLTRGDATFAILALLIGAKGFVLGLLLGKWTASLGLLPRGTNLSPQLIQLYPVLLAIIFDQLI